MIDYRCGGGATIFTQEFSDLTTCPEKHVSKNFPNKHLHLEMQRNEEQNIEKTTTQFVIISRLQQFDKLHENNKIISETRKMDDAIMAIHARVDGRRDQK